MWRAEQLGGVEHFGWGDVENLLTNLGDLLQTNNSIADAARTSRRPKKITPLYRPSVVRELRPKTLAEVNWSFFKH